MRPNIVLILADDLGYGDLGCFGNAAVHTPHVDALAAGGLRLLQHYSASAVCAPARAGLLTGRYPHRTGAIDTLEGRGLDRLAPREATLADHLKAAGYATGLVGKWHNGALDAREGGAYHPNRRGFDEFAGFRGGWQDYYDWRLDYNGSARRTDGRYLTDVFTDEAVSFIDRHSAGGPFFLHLAYNAPHTPLQVADGDADPFRETGRFHEAVCRLYGMVRRMDAGVGRVVEALRRRRLLEDTLILFTSDNGPQLGSELGPGSLSRDNGGLRGSKTTVFEGGIRVPAVAHWPAGLPGGGAVVSGLVHFTDWLPTLLEAAGATRPADALPLDGASILPLLRGETGAADPVRFWQWNRYTPVGDGNAAMRDGRWKLVRPSIPATMVVARPDLDTDRRLKYEPDAVTDIERGPEPARVLPDDAPPAPLLFDLEADPLEQDDRSAAEPDRVRRMQAALDYWFADVERDRRAAAGADGR